MNASYTIRTVRDLYQLPTECLDDCLADLKASIESHKALASLVQVPCEPLEAIEWIDDGKHDLKVEIRAEASK